ncbi:uncharacterized protein LOC110715908 [Chenopodium quinoa]|uniref:uncharacterized protein LOC110715908 n=1 Tax=Chenopodium quinoa TaxID=63459 RepID=UPI000B789DE1|nr:uncharacterized protein LOC110715908 [Chenopodium quinoa]
MADDLSSRWKNLNISPEEKEYVDLRVEGAKMDVRLSLCLLGQLITNKKFNKEAMKRTLKSVWNLSNGVVIRNLDYDIFMFQFFHWKDMKKVQDGAPWCFDNQLLVLKEVESGKQPWQVEFTQCLFWLRIYDLPFDSNTVEDAKAVASRVGEVVEVNEIDEVGWETSFRVRVLMDIRKPIKRWQKIKNKAGQDAWVVFKYERLPMLCFECGLIGHTDKDCLEDRTKARKEVLELKARGPLEFIPLPEAMMKDREDMDSYIEGTENMMQANISKITNLTNIKSTENMLQTNISTTGAGTKNMLQINIHATGAGTENMMQTNISTTGAANKQGDQCIDDFEFLLMKSQWNDLYS